MKRVGLLLLCVIIGFQCHHYFSHCTDDAFIFFRYAQNVADGYGPVWNRGLEPVEGFSSPLWVLLLSFGIFLGLSPVEASLCFGGLSLVGLFVVQWRLCSLLGMRAYGLLSILLLSLMGTIYYWGLSGMETALFAFLFLSSVRSLLDGKGWWSVPLMTLSRPEGPGLLILWALCFLWRFPDRKKHIVYALVLPVLYLLFRLQFYGELLPNTYYAKVGAPILERIVTGITYAQAILLALLPLAIWAYKDRKPETLILLGACLVELAVIVIGGGDWMMWGRLLIPLLAPILVLSLYALSHRWYLALFSIVALYPFATSLTAWSHSIQGEKLPTRWFQEGTLYKASEYVAKEIRSFLPKDSLIAINHAGFVPFFLLEYTFVDMTGLNDHHIAHQVQGGLHQKYDSAYVLSQKPDLIVMNSLQPPEEGNIWFDYWEGETNLARQAEFQERYRLLDIHKRQRLRTFTSLRMALAFPAEMISSSKNQPRSASITLNAYKLLTLLSIAFN